MGLYFLDYNCIYFLQKTNFSCTLSTLYKCRLYKKKRKTLSFILLLYFNNLFFFFFFFFCFFNNFFFFLFRVFVFFIFIGIKRIYDYKSAEVDLFRPINNVDNKLFSILYQIAHIWLIINKNVNVFRSN